MDEYHTPFHNHKKLNEREELTMLKTSKSITINGTSKLSTGEIVATMHCTIKENGEIVSSDNIVNKSLYDENKELVRADMDEFTMYCRLIEDGEKVEVNE